MELEKNALAEGAAQESELPETGTADAESAAPAEAESLTDEEAPEIPLSITVDDGLRRIPINNKMGEKIGEFRFRPGDFEIVTRFNRMAERWDEVTEALDGVRDGEDGTVDLTDPEVIAAMDKAKKKLFELCDYAFGGGASEAFFGVVNPFSPIDGNLYCENVFAAAGDFLSRYFQRETRKINSRVKAYLPQDHKRKGGKRRQK